MKTYSDFDSYVYGYLNDLVMSLRFFRAQIISIMSGLGHGTKRYYKNLCKIVNKIDKDIKYYSNLEV